MGPIGAESVGGSSMFANDALCHKEDHAKKARCEPNSACGKNQIRHGTVCVAPKTTPKDDDIKLSLRLLAVSCLVFFISCGFYLSFWLYNRFKRRRIQETLRQIYAVNYDYDPGTPAELPSISVPEMPLDLTREGHLALHQGQLVLVTRWYKDGWWYGSVILDKHHGPAHPGTGRPSGWFYSELVAPPKAYQIDELHKSLGLCEVSSLCPPPTWNSTDDSSVVARFKLREASNEWKDIRDRVYHADEQCNEKFHGPFERHFEILQIERIQNTSLWSLVTVNMRQRLVGYQKAVSTIAQNSHQYIYCVIDKRYIDSILENGLPQNYWQQGSDRQAINFEIYALAAASTALTTTDANATQHMLLARVPPLPLGALNASTRTTNRVFDSTVAQRLSANSIYPEYVIKFRKCPLSNLDISELMC